MAITNTKYILSTKKDENFYHFCVGKYINKNNIFYIYRIPKEIYEKIPQKYFGDARNIKEIFRTLELLGEYENGSQLPTKNSNKC